MIESAIAFLIAFGGLTILIFLLSQLSSAIDILITRQTSTPEHEQDQSTPYHDYRHPVEAAITSYQQQRQTHESDRAKRDVITIKVLLATGGFALIAAFAAIYSDWIFSSQLDAMREDQRAWVGPIYANVASFPSDPNGSISVTIPLRNTGHQPAIRTILIGNSENIDIRAPAKEINSIEIEYAMRCLITPKSENQSFVIFPSSNIANDYIGHVDVKKDKIDWGVVYGTIYLLIRGCAIYETIGKVAHTAFCYYAQAGVVELGFLRLCDRGNEAN